MSGSNFLPEILSSDENGLYRWFEGGKLNTSYLALDYHIKHGLGDKVALIYDSPVTGTIRKYSFSEMLSEVEKAAGMLHALGVEKGDRVIIYMPIDT